MRIARRFYKVLSTDLNVCIVRVWGGQPHLRWCVHSQLTSPLYVIIISTMEEYFVGWLFYRASRHYLGREVNMALHKDTQRFWREHPSPRLCCFCRKHIKWKDRSIDHIVPKSVCNDLGLIGLLFDDRNFRIAHGDCNSRRGKDTSDIPEPILAKLIELGYAP